MRRIRTAGVGISLALATGAVSAQTTDTPAARITRVQAIDSSGSARGQTPMPMPVAASGGSVVQPPGASAALTMPKPLPAPTVTEIPGNPAATFGQSVPVGTPVVVGNPFVVGQPVAGAPVAAPSVLPGNPMYAGSGAICPDLDAPLYGGAMNTLTGPGKFQLRSDLLLWYVRAGHVPPLITGSSVSALGIPGVGDTRVLLGDGRLGNTYHVGGNFGGVYWFGCNQCWGVDGDVFFLGRNGNSFTASTADAPLIGRPFFNLNQGIPFSQIVGAQGLATGAIAVTNETSMWGADINLRRHLWCNPCSRLDGFVGFRYLNLSEELAITENFARTPGSPPSIGVPTAVSGTVTDFFRTDNHFYGAQVGLTGEVRRGRWFLEGRTSVAMGDVVQTATIGGSQTINFANGTSATTAGGMLALPGANIGTFTRNRFGVLPEVGVKIGLDVTPHLRLAVGYNFLYLNSVIRPGDQIDPGLDVTRIPNFPLPGNPQRLAAVRPTPTLRDSDVFAQGISFSLTWNW